MARRLAPKRGAQARSPAGRDPFAFKLDRHIFYLFGQIYGRRDQQLAKSLRPFRLSVPQWRVLAALVDLGTSTINRLSDLTVVDRTTLSRTLDRMERNGLVARKRVEADKRSYEMRLTAGGRAMFRRIWPVMSYHNARAIAGLSERELARLKAIIKKMIANVAAPPEM
jgi:MarR family transcriptional regulator, organic hydroperoxide resistance regulator